MAKSLLDPESQPKFVNSLPVPPVIDATKPGTQVLQIQQTPQWLGLIGTDGSGDGVADPLLTTVWGYGQPGKATTYPGPTIVAHTGQPIQVMWQNQLPQTGHLLPVDTSIHLAMPLRKTLDKGYVPIVTHLHGGHSASSSDGLPEAWFTQNFAERGPDFGGQVLTYTNSQQSATLWYHDHTLGITRLNVYAGLAGFYLLRDDNEENLVSSGVLPARQFEAGAAIQDRAFTQDGQLYLPAFADDPIPGTNETVKDALGPDFTGTYPSIVPEFFGDFILVNGMAWPKFDADPGQYRLHLLNGSDSRFYSLQLDNAFVKVTLIGSDGGLLPRAVTILDGDGVQEPGEKLVLAPGDRADVVFDFSALQLRGQSVTLLNNGPAYEPFKGLAPDGSLAGGVQAAQPTDTVGQVMRFNIGQVDLLPNSATVTDGTNLNPGFAPLSESAAAHVRKLGLFEGTDAQGHVTPTLGVAEDTTDIDGNPVPFGPLLWDDPVTETPALGTTEVWQIYNFTADAHPIHLHLTQFQLLGRHEISFLDANDDGIPDNIRGTSKLTVGSDPSVDDVLQKMSLPLSAMDMGWQDTAWVGPNELMTVIGRFDLPGEYVWHCHILSHEDNEMMRPFIVSGPGQSV